VVHGILYILVDMGVGFLQDKEIFVFRIFNKERWGRRAPWLLLHCPLMACLMYAGWAPPSLDGSFLAHWYFWTQLLGMWCCEHLLIGNMAGSAEAYPYKAERVVVESLNVAFACFGVICSILIIGVAYADEQLDEKPGLRSTLGLACLVVGLLSLPSAWALRDARQPCDAAKIDNFFSSARDVMSNEAFRIYFISNFLEGLAGGIQSSFFLYYFTFVAALEDAEIAQWIVVVPVLGLLTQAGMGAVWAKVFQSADPTKISAYGRVADAVVSRERSNGRLGL